MVKQDLLTQSKGIPVLRSALLSLLLIFVFSSQSLGQNQIACNDLVQVSLDDECEAVIRPDMVMEGGPQGANQTHRVRVSGVTPTVPYTHPVVTNPGLYTVTITNPSGNFCWGQIRVEDKLPPQVDCLCPVGNEDPACTLRCTDEAAFLANTLYILDQLLMKIVLLLLQFLVITSFLPGIVVLKLLEEHGYSQISMVTNLFLVHLSTDLILLL